MDANIFKTDIFDTLKEKNHQKRTFESASITRPCLPESTCACVYAQIGSSHVVNPKNAEWKLLLRGAESTRRCISVAFLDADKRCLENCRNFSPAGWLGEERKGEEGVFRYERSTDPGQEDPRSRGETRGGLPVAVDDDAGATTATAR